MSSLLLPNEILSMSAQAARRLVEQGDGDCALLYLALLQGGEEATLRQRLRWEEDRLERAWEGLARLELVQRSAPAPKKAPQPQPDDRLPEYSREDLCTALEQESDFQGLYREMERLLGRSFSDHDLKCLYTIYDFLALPVEVILMVGGYVVQRARRNADGKSAFPRMPQVQKEAFRWKRLGVDTPERAEQFLRRQQLVDGREWAVLSCLGFTQPRPAVAQEREFIERWVELGLSDELIRLAYERTVYQKGELRWPYLNKILLSWHQAGYTTPEQVKAGDKPPAKSAPTKGKASRGNYQPSNDRIRKNNDWLDQFLENQEKGR